MTDILIIGAGSVGGHIAIDSSQYFRDKNIIGFLDDDTSKIGTNFCGYTVLGKIEEIVNFPKTIEIVVGIAFPNIKATIVAKLKQLGYSFFPPLISIGSWISKNVIVGEGVIVYPGTSINYNTRIGNFVLFNMNCSIGHDCTIGDLSSLAPSVNLAGYTAIGEGAEIGIGSSTIQYVNIGNKSRVGAGAVVIKSVPDFAVVVGNPARIIKYI